MNILFVTGNKGKIEEAAHILSRWGIGVYQSTNLHKVEIQSNELGNSDLCIESIM